MKKVPDFLADAHDPRDPNPWLAIYLDSSIPIDEDVKRAWLEDSSSRSRQFLLPVVRPLARTCIVLVQLLKIIMPSSVTSSRVLHRFLAWSLKHFVSPNANWLILRHFNLGAEILAFVAANVPDAKIPPLNDMRLTGLDQIKDDAFLKHDLNLFNFVIYLNRELRAQGRQVEPVVAPDFSAITDGPLPLQSMPDRWTNVIDLQTAIELYTPVYQLFLTDNDFWRATNSLQVDETIAIYASRILNDPTPMLLVNNRHPLVPMSTLRAGFRLVLHGLSTEMMHALLVKKKREQALARARNAACEQVELGG
ncbi:hypothetical protein IU514_03550 [Lysobacter niastensis]|uniref:Uncharacterized protein n=1 Tax=Lysobacter niastensis TaxID=380629 RepID=A0ABS0B3P9_9GAMM|nr:hypothetical protein [Lysobacter niastensis]